MPTPSTAAEALSGPNRHEWKQSIEREIASLRKHNVFEFAPLPHGRKPIKMKWIFRVKQDENGNVLKLKSRLTACGYAQRWNIDYLKVFAPVASYTTIRMVIAHAAMHDWELEQMDVDTAFLNSPLDVPIYCTPPNELGAPPGMHVLLKRALYGLKQGSRCFNILLHEFLVGPICKLQQSKHDPCLYTCRNNEITIVMAIFVDDLLLSAPTMESIVWLKAKLKSKFEMTDQGPLTWILGMHVTRDRDNGIVQLDQSRYILDFLKKYGMLDANASNSPCDTKVHLTKPQSPPSPEEEAKLSRQPHKYSAMIGSALYAALSTRFDIAFPVNSTGRHAAWARSEHFSAIKRVFRYLKGTHKMCIQYGRSALNNFKQSNTLFAYSDSDWAGCHDTRKSTSCHVIYFCNGPVQTVTRTLKCIALSSADAEYYALSDTTRELVHWRRIAGDITGEPHENAPPTMLFVDNESAMTIAHSESCTRRSKHIQIRYHHVRELITTNIVKLVKIDTEYNIADIGTKALPAPRFKFLRDRLMSKIDGHAQYRRPMTIDERKFYDRAFELNRHTFFLFQRSTISWLFR